MKFTLKPQTFDVLSFAEVVEIGRRLAQQDAESHGGYAWHFKHQGATFTHENDGRYIVAGPGPEAEFVTLDLLSDQYLAIRQDGALFVVTGDDLGELFVQDEEPDTSPMGIAGTTNPDGSTNVAAGFLVHGAVSNPGVFPQMAHLALENYLKRGKVGHDFQHEATGLTVSLALFGQDGE